MNADFQDPPHPGAQLLSRLIPCAPVPFWRRHLRSVAAGQGAAPSQGPACPLPGKALWCPLRLPLPFSWFLRCPPLACVLALSSLYCCNGLFPCRSLRVKGGFPERTVVLVFGKEPGSFEPEFKSQLCW